MTTEVAALDAKRHWRPLICARRLYCTRHMHWAAIVDKIADPIEPYNFIRQVESIC